MAHGERPNVCYVLPHYDPAAGSHFIYRYEFLELAARELHLFVVVEKCSARPPPHMFPAYCQRFSAMPLRLAESILLFFRERFRGRRHFYVHYSFYGAIAAWLVTCLAGGRVYYWNCGMPWLYRRSWYAEAVFRFILRHTILVTGTPGLACVYTEHYRLNPSRIRVLPNWIDAGRSRPAESAVVLRVKLGIPSSSRVVLFVHRLSRRKGADRIPAIAAGVTKRFPNAMFLIVGDGPERERVELKIQNSELAGVVRFVGEVSHRDISDYFAAADIFFMPSEEEGFPHVLLEAMAAGLPYVASDVGGVREITPPALQSYLVPSGDTQRFVERIGALLGADPRERAAISAAEREWVKRYDISAALQKFKNLFR
ncbi:MAG: glycosyltransferase family 4 protein [bacterium]|nr:glycosyltransferase family 4 protein [bacterium]